MVQVGDKGIVIAHLSALLLQKMDHIQRRGFTQVINIGFIGHAQNQHLAAIGRLLHQVERILNLAQRVARHIGVDLGGQFNETGVIVQGFKLP